ncbi:MULTISPECIES: aspartate aminotransferase family protein [Bacillus]|uniref:aspartate aminotransferase family protein n=1 Tax=Bacillus TaxID=1386 RepID=UPI001583BD63|nr:aspartate aminotransferase family protein [Bacillus glycinifermentans]MBU8785890.1 aminotransferase class III-fold pyridoxal phosphate-dependent enzyme [Bacillus glycinifermentans]NUJ15574.1 aspartate aminotransferase family protein [Bacillus glycinifermentans]
MGTKQVANPDSLYYKVDDVVMVRGEGIHLYDQEDNEYIDCASATFNLNLGYSNKEVIDAVKDQADKLIHVTSSFQTDAVNQLAEKLVEISPDNLTKVHPKVSSGSAANEGAIKMAQYYSGKRDVISLFRSHLGQTYMMSALSGNSFRREPFPPQFSFGLQVPDPYCQRCFYKQKPDTCGMLCVERIHDFIEYASSGKVAAIIVEPISGNGGNIVPPKGYLKALKQLCEEHDIALIFDEIQTGFGRTGKMFAAEHFDVKPNMMTVAKGLGGTGFQVAATLTEEKYTGLPGHHHSFTYGSNVMASAAACATIDIMQRPGFLENVTTVGNYIMESLEDMKQAFPFIGDVRGLGLMIGVEIVKDDFEPDVELTNYISKRAMDYGLIIRTSRYGYGNVFKIRPPLTITLSEAEMLCYRLRQLLEAVK